MNYISVLAFLLVVGLLLATYREIMSLRLDALTAANGGSRILQNEIADLCRTVDRCTKGLGSAADAEVERLRRIGDLGGQAILENHFAEEVEGFQQAPQKAEKLGDQVSDYYVSEVDAGRGQSVPGVMQVLDHSGTVGRMREGPTGAAPVGAFCDGPAAVGTPVCARRDGVFKRSKVRSAVIEERKPSSGSEDGCSLEAADYGTFCAEQQPDSKSSGGKVEHTWCSSDCTPSVCYEWDYDGPRCEYVDGGTLGNMFVRDSAGRSSVRTGPTRNSGRAKGGAAGLEESPLLPEGRQSKRAT